MLAPLSGHRCGNRRVRPRALLLTVWTWPHEMAACHDFPVLLDHLRLCVGGNQRWQVFQPERGALGIGAAEVIRLHGLRWPSQYAHGETMRLRVFRGDELYGRSHQVIECLRSQDCVRRFDRPGTLFYLDPPYWETEGYGVDFPFSEYKAMAELMRDAAGRFVVSINDHPQIREVFAGFDLVPLQLDYTIGGWQGRRRKFGELIINSWDDRQASLI